MAHEWLTYTHTYTKPVTIRYSCDYNGFIASESDSFVNTCQYT
jgi:hypothetical protein